MSKLKLEHGVEKLPVGFGAQSCNRPSTRP